MKNRVHLSKRSRLEKGRRKITRQGKQKEVMVPVPTYLVARDHR